MLHVRISIPPDLLDDVVSVFESTPAVSQLTVLPGVSRMPAGDVVLVDIAREAANEALERLVALGVPARGTVHVDEVGSWISQAGLEAEVRTPGAGADAVVWADVTQRAYEDSELNWTYLTFMTLATVLAAIAIVVDSQVLVIGAMVLGPEFVPIAALGLGLVRRRPVLLARAVRALVVGFVVAIALTCLLSLLARATGWVVAEDVTGPRPGTDFIYSPDRWSFVVALIAAAAGVLSLTSDRLGGLSGVFISVTTVPAAGNIALGIAFGAWDEVTASSLQLALNVSGMVVAGWATLAVQDVASRRARARRVRRAAPSRPMP